MALSAFDDKALRPDPEQLRSALGASKVLWRKLLAHAAERDAHVVEHWHFAGPKYGWSLRVKQKDRVVLHLTPCKGAFPGRRRSRREEDRGGKGSRPSEAFPRRAGGRAEVRGGPRHSEKGLHDPGSSCRDAARRAEAQSFDRRALKRASSRITARSESFS